MLRNEKGRFLPSKPKGRKPKANPHIVKKGDTERITKIDEKFEPCKKCRLKEECQRYLGGGLKVEYYRKNNNCIVEGDTARF